MVARGRVMEEEDEEEEEERGVTYGPRKFSLVCIFTANDSAGSNNLTAAFIIIYS